jgi:hypothetical protein
MKKIFIILYILSINISFAEQNYTPMNKPAPKRTPAESKKFCAYKDGDIVVGNPKTAKVTVTGYTAFACPHCNHFVGDIMPKLKKEYFENVNKNIIYIYRTFPMSASDVKAKQLLLCKQWPMKKMIELNEMLYATSASWVHNAKFEQKLTEIARLFGFADKDIFLCFGSKKLEDKVLMDRMEIMQKTGLAGVPAIFVNGKMIEGYSYKAIAEAIESELKFNK